MSKISWLALVPMLAALAGCGRAPEGRSAVAAEPAFVAEAGANNDFIGRTQPAPGRAALICPVPLHPVEEVLVKVGDRVKKGDKLVRLDDDEPQADVRAKEAILESAGVCTKEAQLLFNHLEPLHRSGSVSEQTYHKAKSALAKCQADERAADANLHAAKAELEHYLLTSPIDGIIASLNVVPGQVSRPGTTIWGQIIDPSEIDIRCDVPPAQADRLALGQSANVSLTGLPDLKMSAQVVNVGIAGDPQTGKVPVLLRVDNRSGKLRCYVEVKVRFTNDRQGAKN
jgi:RND family efflux transporter MFP subunit